MLPVMTKPMPSNLSGCALSAAMTSSNVLHVRGLSVLASMPLGCNGGLVHFMPSRVCLSTIL